MTLRAQKGLVDRVLARQQVTVLCPSLAEACELRDRVANGVRERLGNTLADYPDNHVDSLRIGRAHGHERIEFREGVMRFGSRRTLAGIRGAVLDAVVLVGGPPPAVVEVDEIAPALFVSRGELIWTLEVRS